MELFLVIKKSKMKKYLMILSVLVFVACNNSQKAEDLAREAIEHDNEVRQRIIDSIATVNMQQNHSHSNSSSSAASTSASNDNATSTDDSSTDDKSTDSKKKKKMSNTTKGALIGTGAGIVGGAVTGAAVSKDKGKGAVIGAIIGGAVGSGVGYGVGADKDKKKKDMIK